MKDFELQIDKIKIKFSKQEGSYCLSLEDLGDYHESVSIQEHKLVFKMLFTILQLKLESDV